MENSGVKKTEIKQQISLDIGLKDSSTFASFYNRGNEQVLADIANFIDDNQIKILYLWGSSGSGKTHLLHAIQNQELEKGGVVYYLPFSNVKNYPVEALEGLETASLICLDELEHIAGIKHWEEAVFHLLNRTWENGNKVVIAASGNIQEIGISLPDLQSRLTWGLNSKLNELDDVGKQLCLKFRASLRGFELNEDVCSFLLKRLPRNMQQLFEFLELIDKQTLVEKRKVTIPFIKSLLESYLLDKE